MFGSQLPADFEEEEEENPPQPEHVMKACVCAPPWCIHAFFHQSPGSNRTESNISPAAAQTRVKKRCVSLNAALEEIGDGEFHMSLVLLDCCRNRPFAGAIPLICRCLHECSFAVVAALLCRPTVRASPRWIVLQLQLSFPYRLRVRSCVDLRFE